MKLYLDLNVISYSVRPGSKPRPWPSQSRRLMDLVEFGAFQAFTSITTIAEIDGTPDVRLRRKLIRQVTRSKVGMLPAEWEEQAEHLGAIYRRRGVVPAKCLADSLHLAWATLGGADMLVSWNRRQMVRLKTREQVAIINIALGYSPLDVQRPSEVIGEFEGP